MFHAVWLTGSILTAGRSPHSEMQVVQHTIYDL
jgi:hypothetical protein